MKQNEISTIPYTANISDPQNQHYIQVHSSKLLVNPTLLFDSRLD